MTKFFFSPLSFVAVLGSGIRDPGSGINIPDPPHCIVQYVFNDEFDHLVEKFAIIIQIFYSKKLRFRSGTIILDPDCSVFDNSGSDPTTYPQHCSFIQIHVSQP
jgi:hypothetical protein